MPKSPRLLSAGQQVLQQLPNIAEMPPLHWDHPILCRGEILVRRLSDWMQPILRAEQKRRGRPYESSIQWLYTAGGRGIGGRPAGAQQAGHTYIGSEHLLLALLREGPERLIRCFFSGV